MNIRRTGEEPFVPLFQPLNTKPGNQYQEIEVSTSGASQEDWDPNAKVFGDKSSPMLVLTRKKNESIVINDFIKVTVVEIRGDKVRLGIEAPKEIDVHRQEVYDQIHGKHQADEASSVDPTAARERAESEAEQNRAEQEQDLPPTDQ